MTFLLDHDVPEAIADTLRRQGHTAICLREIMPIRSPDPEVMAEAERRGCVVITCNRDDFLRLCEAAFDAGRAITGLIVLIRRHRSESECAHLSTLLREAGEAGLSGNINFA